MVELAKNSFSAPVNQKKRHVNKPDNFPSAATLVSAHDRNGTGNCFTGVNDAAQQPEFVLRSRKILSRGRFNLRNWENNVESETKITKRLVLAIAQKFFDPICILCSVILTPKILLQNTWKLKLSWDSPLPDEIVKPFLKWWNEIKILSAVEIPRYFGINDSTQMHVFVDSCKEAYATCIFFRSNTSQGVKIALVRAKARVVPIKQETIPSLELMACCIGVCARLAFS
ncbi:uncharacterized protein TNIN_146701 [Trichonephila inaurata madagascariensis]|uniref:Uncharacterized protein n=1 Tax=Trichonephila inaurata madagascariensis TaxID=2747483 RepID=A0A8X6MGY7_9ARAC|nr:uncharacterized protein TNIN_146701 [Trichonephila inaurata madagascariensis]